MVPARLAEKMSVMSVGTSPFSARRTIAAERVHRPGSRRLGGVEATGASPGVAPSRPHRSGPRAGPGRRTPCARGAWGGERAGGWASDMPNSLKCRRGPRPELSGSAHERACRRTFARSPLKKKGTRSLLLAMLLEQVGMMAQKIGKCFLEPPTASPRRSDRANASGTGAEAFSAMKLRPFPARISETVRNIDRAR